MVGRLFIFWLIPLTTLSCWGQAIRLEINSTKIAVGERLELKVISDVNGAIEIKTPTSFHYGTTEQSSMQQQLHHSGKLTIELGYLRDGYFDSPGTFVLGPATLKSGKKVITSNTINVEVTKIPSIGNNGTAAYNRRDLKKAAFGVINLNKVRIYEGEPLVLEAKILARLNLDNMSRYRAYTIEGSVSSHELGNPEQIKSSSERIIGIDWSTYTFDRKVIFFNKKGSYKIKPFAINVESNLSYLPVQSNSPNIEVLALPENRPKNFSGIIGDISLSMNIKTKPSKKGEMLTFTLDLEGRGNIQNALVPIVKAPKGWKEYTEPKSSSRYTFTDCGAEGKLTYEYCYQCITDKPTNWEPISLSYFDPSKGKYKTVKSSPIIFDDSGTIEPKNDISGGGTSESAETTLVQNASNNEDSNSTYKNPILWVTLIVIIGFAFFVGIVGRPKYRKRISMSVDDSKPYVATWNLVEVDINKAEKALELGENNSAIQHFENSVCKAMSIKLNIDHRGLSSESITQSFIGTSTNFDLNTKINDFFLQAQFHRYGTGITNDDLMKLRILAKDLLKLLKM